MSERLRNQARRSGRNEQADGREHNDEFKVKCSCQVRPPCSQGRARGIGRPASGSVICVLTRASPKLPVVAGPAAECDCSARARPAAVAEMRPVPERGQAFIAAINRVMQSV